MGGNNRVFRNSENPFSLPERYVERYPRPKRQKLDCDKELMNLITCVGDGSKGPLTYEACAQAFFTLENCQLMANDNNKKQRSYNYHLRRGSQFLKKSAKYFV
eukprot:TRINITY_DN15216_c0_g1_i1.p1 TRINITY_DN15216_c0_g1~~TRINITY_DN15216_c0_g1_i1.p1  ORF type:complete len:103 (-),score=22.06 TRINITY_DN15216_c0_g1_i1:131-439(-)